MDLDKYVEDFSMEEDLPEIPTLTLNQMTLDYCIHVVENDHKVTVYRIVNRSTGVDEYEDHYLARVLNMVLEMQKSLDEAMAKFNRPQLSIAGGKDEREGSLC